MNEPYHLLTKIRFAALLIWQPKIWIKFSKMDLEITFNCCCMDPTTVNLVILHFIKFQTPIFFLKSYIA